MLQTYANSTESIATVLVARPTFHLTTTVAGRGSLPEIIGPEQVLSHYQRVRDEMRDYIQTLASISCRYRQTA
ncbi:hypothetical protein ACERK3_17565 [Phycisphaerales bacterium AB-hyl4]|uniref:Uncharacterized protein n=1 Tax=Natronomicrosphaera hydrolytica TaxID=3242702 RepID=A0ABV4UB76_9BACT